jgi:F-type H+-transporting ATPase subunit epsilon
MRLVVTTPTAIAIDEDDVRYVRGEDASGSFGIEPRHADLLTTLIICVIRWRSCDGRERYVAVRGGVLRVQNGSLVEIATREAVVGDDLTSLRGQVLSAMMKNLEADQAARSDALRLEHAVVRKIYRYLRPADQPIKATPEE